MRRLLFLKLFSQQLSQSNSIIAWITFLCFNFVAIQTNYGWQAKANDDPEPSWIKNIGPGIITIGQINRWSQLQGVQVSPDGKWVAAQNHLNQLVVIDADDHSVVATHPIKKGDIHKIVFSPTGNRLAIVTLAMLTRQEQAELQDENPKIAHQPIRNSVQIFDRNFISQLELPIPTYQYGSRGQAVMLDLIHDIVFSPSGDRLLLTGPGGPRVLDLDTQEFSYYTAEDLRSGGFFLSDDQVYFPANSSIWNVQNNELQSSDRLLPLARSNFLAVDPGSGWVLANGVAEPFLFNVREQKRQKLEAGSRFDIARLSGDAHWVAGVTRIGNQSEIAIWNVSTGSRKHSCVCKEGHILNVGFLQNNQQLIAEVLVGSQRRIILATLDSNFEDSFQHQLSNLPITKSIEVGNKNRWAVIDDGRVLIDIKSGKQSPVMPLDYANSTGFSVELQLVSDAPQLVQLSSDGEVASLTSAVINDFVKAPKISNYRFRSKQNATANFIVGILGGENQYDTLFPLAVCVAEKENLTSCLFYGTTSGTRLVQYNSESESIVNDFKLSTKADVEIGQNSLAAFSGDGLKLIYGTSEDWIVVDIESRKENKLSRGNHDFVRMNHDGSLIVTGKSVNKGSSFCYDVELVNMSTEGTIRQFSNSPVSVSVARNSDELLIMDQHGMAELLDWSSGETIRKLGPTQAAPTAAQLSPDGSTVVIGLADSRLEIWDLAKVTEFPKR